MNQKAVLLVACVLGFLGVALGAFGAHALKPILEANGRLDTYELAVRYQLFHALALLALGILMNSISAEFLSTAAVFLFVGVILFSGSLYVLSLASIRWAAFITPFGGLSMLIGWALAGWAIYKHLR
jgi:uncharacterized membrane protein YgdD (TMEM256/DUF423 family)